MNSNYCFLYANMSSYLNGSIESNNSHGTNISRIKNTNKPSKNAWTLSGSCIVSFLKATSMILDGKGFTRFKSC